MLAWGTAATMALALAAAAPAAADGWSVLRDLRARLEAAPQVAEFEQEFLPAGFASGDRETGRLTLALPDCLRWDYDEPFAKSYLLCGSTVWTWNPGEESGRTFFVEPDEERGLDLLRLGVERLAERYSAELVDGPPATVAVRLLPLGSVSEIAEATVTLGGGDRRLRELSYRDAEGNTTRFAFRGHRRMAADDPELAPPGELTWIENR